MDYVSLSYVLAFIYLINFVILYFLSKENDDIPGLRYWFISATIGVFAFLSVFLKPWIGDYTAFLNNGLILTGFMFTQEGILQFRGWGTLKKRLIVWIPLVILAFVMSFINTSNATNRYLMYDVFLSGLLFTFPVILLYRQKSLLKIYILPSVFAIFLALVHLVRWYFAYTGVISSYDGVHPVVAYAYFAGIMFSITWVISILLIIQNKYYDQLHYIASHDVLTSCLNRRSFETQVPKIFNDISDNHILSIIDINRFKNINDAYGHNIGDDVIVELTRKVSDAFPEGYLYRIGGDEFALVTMNVLFNDIKQTLENSLKENLLIDGKDIALSISVGSSYFKDFANLEELYKQADHRMYIEKKEFDIKNKNL